MADKIKVRYEGLLLSFIKTAQNEQFKALNADLIKNSSNWMTLLHDAAFYMNDLIAQHLIDMGVDVDAIDSNGNTALMIAVEVRSLPVVKVLLKANASIHTIGAVSKSPLQKVCHPEYFDTKILKLILRRLQRDCSSVDELADKLIDAGCSMCHASYLKDIQLMEMLLSRGVDANSTGYCRRTALHAAVETSNLSMAEWILTRGGDVDAVDEYGKSPLFAAATDGKANLVRLLLQRGANPNSKHTNTEYTPLFSVFAFSLDESDQKEVDKCVELLLRHGAIPENSSIDRNTIFDYALFNPAPHKKIDYLIGQLAILARLGKCDAKSIMRCNVEEHASILAELNKIYKSRMELLELKIYGNISLFDLLTQSEDKIRIHARNNMILSRIAFICPMLTKLFSYYSKILQERLSKAVAAVRLEEQAIPVFSKLFNANYNLCYNLARHVVGYLSERDLEQLRQV